jgi:hypothetical protein
MGDKCPKCGADRIVGPGGVKVWRCGYWPDDEDGFQETWECLRRQRDHLEAKVAELEAQLAQAETILDAVNAMEFGGIYCDDVDGENWFDARDKFLAKYRKGD